MHNDDAQTNRRTFLQIAGAALGTTLLPRRSAAAQAPASAAAGLFAAPPMNEVRIGFVGVGGQGGSHVRNMLRVPGARVTAICDIVPERVAQVQKWVVEAGQKEPAGYSTRPARLRAALRQPGRRSRLQRDAVGMARPRLRRGDEERQAHGRRGAGGDDARRLLGAGRTGREAPQALRDDGELQLRPFGDAGLQHGAAGPVRRGPARRGRLPARPARDQVRQPR